MKTIVLATRNRYKIEELKFFISGLPVEILTLDDFPHVGVLIEDGRTFEENALKKAQQVFEQTKHISLADDSGLEVAFLNGRPGVYSARYAGSQSDDLMNNEKLLGEMRGVPARRRSARFRAVLALVGPGIKETTSGECAGVLCEFPRGSNGFGYDPIFKPNGFSRTYAELTADEKNNISHRSRAFAAMLPILAKYC
jgi:XTP/dITP diphosphohydrolase